jgi:thiamine biosynthesis lipoprotein ApbE
MEMERIKIITSVEYWVEALKNKSYNKISNENFAKDIVSKLNEAINYTRCCESDSELLKIPKTTKEQRVQLNEGYNKK